MTKSVSIAIFFLALIAGANIAQAGGCYSGSASSTADQIFEEQAQDGN